MVSQNDCSSSDGSVAWAPGWAESGAIGAKRWRPHQASSESNTHQASSESNTPGVIRVKHTPVVIRVKHTRRQCRVIRVEHRQLSSADGSTWQKDGCKFLTRACEDSMDEDSMTRACKDNVRGFDDEGLRGFNVRGFNVQGLRGFDVSGH